MPERLQQEGYYEGATHLNVPSRERSGGDFLSELGVSPDQWERYLNSLIKWESGGKANLKPNKEGYMGLYQMGKDEIRESAKRLGIPVPTEDEFLADKNLQTKLFENYTLDHNRQLLKRDPQYAKADPAERLAYLAGAHLGGPGGVLALQHGEDHADSNGTRVSSYVNNMRSALNLEPKQFGIHSTGLPGGHFADSGIEFEQDRTGSSVRYMNPEKYLSMLPPLGEEAGDKAKAKSLAESLFQGRDIEAIPSLEIGGSGDSRKIIDYDGRHRAKAALDAGVTEMPVAFHGLESDAQPKELKGLTQGSEPFNFPVAQKPAERRSLLSSLASEFGVGTAQAAEQPTKPATPAPKTAATKIEPPWAAFGMGDPSQPTLAAQQSAPKEGGKIEPPWEAFRQELEKSEPEPPKKADTFGGQLLQTVGSIAEAPLRVAAGVTRPLVGLEQLIGEGLSAAGVPGARRIADETNAGARSIEEFVHSDPTGVGPWLAGAGELGSLAAVPTAAMGRAGAAIAPKIPSVLRAIGTGAGVGAASGATQPVTSGDYWPEKELQTGLGAGIGAALGGVGPVANALGRIVSPRDVTRALGRMFGQDAREIPEHVAKGARTRIEAERKSIESSTSVPYDGTRLEKRIDSIENEAKGILTNTGERKRILGIADTIRKNVDIGDITGSKAADLIKEGGKIDKAEKSGLKNVSELAGKMRTELRNALHNSMPPATRRQYKEAEREDLALRLFEASREIGYGRVNPRNLAAKTKREFGPEEGLIPQGTAPPTLRLGRAAGQLWSKGPEEARRFAELATTISGILIGHSLFPPLGGIGGGYLGYQAAHLAGNSLARLRLASKSQLREIAPWRNPTNQIGNLAPRAVAPAAASAAMPGETAR